MSRRHRDALKLRARVLAVLILWALVLCRAAEATTCAGLLKFRSDPPPQIDPPITLYLRRLDGRTDLYLPAWSVGAGEYRATLTDDCGRSTWVRGAISGDVGGHGRLFPVIAYSEPGPSFLAQPVPEPGAWALLVLLPVVMLLKRRRAPEATP